MQFNTNITLDSYWKYLIVGLFTVVLIWLLSDVNKEIEMIEEQSPLFEVSTVEVIPVDGMVEIKVIGISSARWQTDVVASVSGRVINLPENTKTGNLLSSGELLVQLKDSLYLSEQKAALARIAQTELALAKIKNEQLVIKRVANGKSKTPFAQLGPHIKSAKADLEAARASYTHTLSKLKETQIKTPYDAVILERIVTPGQWVNSGERIFLIAENKTIDINIGLSASAWKRLGALSDKTKVKAIAPDGKEWIATLYYLSPIMDSITMQRNITLEVSNPYSSDKPLLSGQQVEVVFEGPIQSNMVHAPASVLTEDGKVWSINSGLLILEDIELLDEQAEYVSFRYRNRPTKKRQLVSYPLSSMLVGQKVIAKPVDLNLTKLMNNSDTTPKTGITSDRKVKFASANAEISL